ncbi:MAG TPA: hypothetical protein VI451_22700 [Anaerolineales bacterium]|nr:hypothetical protein [Anaerolineales bacterium]
MKTLLCPSCDWIYQIPDDITPQHCPHCWRGGLTPVEETAFPVLPAEEQIPFNVSGPNLDLKILSFARGIPFAPKDLTPVNLRRRLQAIYLPMYLVDADVEATWQGEAGFNYEVVSHREQYGGQGWQTQQVKETRIRWEPRVGRLKRTYHNIPAPGLEEHKQLIRQLGEYDFKASQFHSQVGSPVTGEPFVRLPNRSTADAWPDAIPGFQTAAAGECRTAAQADHFREFRWQAAYANQNWTQLHLPVYTTCYLDDENRPQPVMLNGQTGRLFGVRRSSMKRAQTTALWILLAAAAAFGISVVLALAGVVFPPLVVAGGIGIFVAFFVALGAIYPIFRAWQFNRSR